MIKPDIKSAPSIKPLINIGALLDIPTGYYVKGKHGENLLLGGLGQLTGVVGIGNSFKSTVMHYMMLSAADKLFSTHETIMMTYDTEVNIHEERLRNFINRFENLKEKRILQNDLWNITDKTIYYADIWFQKLKDYLKEKEKSAKDYTYNTPFLDRDGKSLIKLMMPTFSEIDSLSEFETTAISKIQEDNQLGESGGNTIHMRSGLDKTRFLMEIPHLSGTASHYFLMTAHLGKETQIASGPYQQMPTKKLQHMRMGDKIKGVSDKFFFLLSNCWLAMDAKPFINQTTKAPEYPKNTNENNDSGGSDLNIVTLKQLRSKSGPSGITIELLVSQTEGVMPSLTEFHFIKNKERFGLEGTLISYSLDLYPDVKLSRTTVRGKIDEDKKLRRALNITAELCQMHQYHRSLGDLLCTPKELYSGIKSQGYDWDMILNETRGWWTLDNDKATEKFLSTKDLLEMRVGKYKPYWLK
jgi:uncharacterized protein (UPF0335 family)